MESSRVDHHAAEEFENRDQVVSKGANLNHTELEPTWDIHMELNDGSIVKRLRGYDEVPDARAMFKQTIWEGDLATLLQMGRQDEWSIHNIKSVDPVRYKPLSICILWLIP